jgi:RNA polymerase sigma-70 factor, ECF subfamily
MALRTEDAELARLVQSGDSQARDSLVGTYGAASYRTARSMGVEASTCEDLAQDVMIGLLGMIHRYDPKRASLATLVYRMTINAVNDVLRKMKRGEQRARTSVMMALPSRQAEKEAQRMEFSDMQPLIVQAIKNLPQRQRQVSVLHDLEGLSIADTAEALKLSVTNVRVHLTHARRKLRETLAHLLED